MKTKTKKELAIGGGALLAVGALAAGTAIAMRSMLRIPKGVMAVKPFDINKFMGKWYEIARLDNRYEKNLNNCTAEYSMDMNGEVKVINRGYNYKKHEMAETEGKALFIGDTNEGRLKVSFFGPFFTAYNIIDIDDNYDNALVAGKDMKHLWLLSRTPSMSEETVEYFLEQAEAFGYDTSKLTWVGHDQYELVVEDVEIYM